MKTNWELYKELELIPDAMWEDVRRKAKLHRLNSRSGLHRVLTIIGNILTKEPEPCIRERYDRNGDVWWEVYDPLARKTRCFSSKAEVMAWLEGRYYRKLS